VGLAAVSASAFARGRLSCIGSPPSSRKEWMVLPHWLAAQPGCSRLRWAGGVLEARPLDGVGAPGLPRRGSRGSTRHAPNRSARGHLQVDPFVAQDGAGTGFAVLSSWAWAV